MGCGASSSFGSCVVWDRRQWVEEYACVHACACMCVGLLDLATDQQAHDITYMMDGAYTGTVI